MKNYIEYTSIIIVFFALSGCNSINQKSDNPVYDKYRSSFKAIQPGFHMLSSSANVYTLKYVGESKSSIEQSKAIWEKRAKEICSESQADPVIDEAKNVQRTKRKRYGNENSSAAGICAVVGVIGCIVVDILSTNYVVGNKIQYPEVVGTVDCNPA